MASNETTKDPQAHQNNLNL